MASRGRPRSFDRGKALRQAMEVFWRKGFENASVSDLTDAMGINPPSLYATFGSKETLFLEAVDLYAKTSGSGIWGPVRTAPTAREAVEHVLRASAEAFTRERQPNGCLIVLAAPQIEGINPAVADELRARRNQNMALLEQRLEHAVEEGELPPPTDTRAIAAYFATVQHGMSIQARDGASREALLAIAECAMAAWDRMVSDRDSSAS